MISAEQKKRYSIKYVTGLRYIYFLHSGQRRGTWVGRSTWKIVRKLIVGFVSFSRNTTVSMLNFWAFLCFLFVGFLFVTRGGGSMFPPRLMCFATPEGPKLVSSKKRCAGETWPVEVVQSVVQKVWDQWLDMQTKGSRIPHPYYGPPFLGFQGATKKEEKDRTQ